jgi:hypothetical protein
MAYSPTLKMVCSSEMSVEFQRTARFYSPEDIILHRRRRRRNAKSYKYGFAFPCACSYVGSRPEEQKESIVIQSDVLVKMRISS